MVGEDEWISPSWFVFFRYELLYFMYVIMTSLSRLQYFWGFFFVSFYIILFKHTEFLIFLGYCTICISC